MTTIKKHTSFGELLRSLREETGQTLKTVAENLEMDTSLLAKIERNERQPTKLIISQVAEYFNVDKKELQTEFLSDQIAYKILVLYYPKFCILFFYQFHCYFVAYFSCIFEYLIFVEL